jgi:mersacidin/lichenicidin family type 2 lantibiotic
MPKSDMVRAWKDPKYRATLGDSGRDAMASSPLSAMGLGKDQLRQAANMNKLTTAWFCTLQSTLGRCCV